MISEPQVSVIIPVYNVEAYVGECLDSVCNQTLKDIEIICINDKSTDASWEIVQRKAVYEERIKLLENEVNRGPSHTRNRGLMEAVGKYIYMLDADDMIRVDALEQLYEKAEKSVLDTVLFDTTVKYEQKEAEIRYKTYLGERKNVYEGVKSGKQMFAEMQQHNEWTCSSPRFFYRNKFLRKNNILFFEGILHEDEYFAFQAILLAERTAFMKEKFFIRRFRDDSIMTRPITDKNFHGYFAAYYMMNKFSFEKKCRTKEVLRYLAVMRKKLQDYYQMLYENYNLEQCFADEEMRDAYRLFADMQNEEAICGAVNEVCLKQIAEFKYCYIYGAGIRAKRLFQVFAKRGLRLNGFIVSDLDGEQKNLLGQEVIEVKDLGVNPQETIVIVSMKADRQEVCEKLELQGIKTIVYEELLEF